MSREKLWHTARWLLALAFFFAVGSLLFTRLRRMDWSRVWESIQSYDATTIIAGLLCTTVAYLAFASYDLLSKHHLGHKVRSPRVLAIALVAYSLNLNLGPLIGGWASRFRLYSRVNIGPATTTQIIGLGMLSNWSGYVLLGGLVFTFAPPVLPAAWEIGPQFMQPIGVALLLLISGYLAVTAWRPRRSWKIRGYELRAPSIGLALAQLSAGTVHWLATGSIMAVFMPDGLAFTDILGVLLLSSMVGAATHIPGGLGVVEGVFVAVFGERFDPALLIGALFAYRASFYLAPLVLGVAAYPFLEIRRRQDTSATSPQWVKG